MKHKFKAGDEVLALIPVGYADEFDKVGFVDEVRNGFISVHIPGWRYGHNGDKENGGTEYWYIYHPRHLELLGKAPSLTEEGWE